MHHRWPSGPRGRNAAPPAVNPAAAESLTVTDASASSFASGLSVSVLETLTVSEATAGTGGSSVDFAWQIPDTSTFITSPSRTDTLALGVPSGGIYFASPDLLPGQSLSVSGNSLLLTGDSTVPSVDGATSGTPIDVISARDIVIEVMDSAISPMIRRTTPGRSKDYSSSAYPTGRWNTVMSEAQTGDTFEIAPGAIHAIRSDRSSGFNTFNPCLLGITKAVSISNMTGRGRWSLFPDDQHLTEFQDGIAIPSPDEMDSPARGNMVIQGFQFDNWGQSGGGIKIRSNNVDTSSWNDHHESLTLRNFKIGRRPYYLSASGIAGTAETWNIEDGHVYDCGHVPFGSPGNDHNFYISGRVLNMFGMHVNRTRANNADGSSQMDGHLAKLSFCDMLIEGCAFVCEPLGDNTDTIQCKGGGNLIVRGCLLLAGPLSSSGNGIIVYEKEVNNFGGWHYGLTGHSVLFEKNVFINHFPYLDPVNMKTMVMFRPPGNVQEVTGISSCVIRDNIGMSTAPSSEWIKNAPSVYTGGAWTANNSEMTYGSSEPGFAADERTLLLYRRTAGTIAASGSVATKRFVWPHGYMARTDAVRGLG